MLILAIVQLRQRRREHEVNQRGCLFGLVWMHIGRKLADYMFNSKEKAFLKYHEILIAALFVTDKTW